MKIKKLLYFILSVMLILSVAPMGLFSIPACAEMATNGTTGNCTWTLDGTVLIISGNGSMENYWYSDSLPWGISITEVIINTGVTSIGDNAFKSCASLTSITIPDSVTNIFGDAFSGCSKLENLTINGAERLYENSFSNCNSLKNIYLSKNLKTVYNRAFDGINSIENIYYEGSEEEWNTVTILPNNDALKKANVYFNSTGIPDEVPTAPELLRKTACTVTLKHTDGYEYRLNDGGFRLPSFALANRGEPKAAVLRRFFNVQQMRYSRYAFALKG